MAAAMIRALLLLPFVVLVVVPGLVVLVTGVDLFWSSGHRTALLALAAVLAAYGVAMGCWTCRLFVKAGRGTPAPWDPPKNLVVQGPYRHVRNPMMSAVFALLAAESLVLGSWGVVGWAALFIVGNGFYIPFSEEPGLEKRFGAAYLDYKRVVPRWIPRLRPYEP